MTASWSGVRSSLWLIPVLCVVGGVALSIGTITVDAWFDFGLMPRWLTGGPDAALSILSTIAASMVSLTALVLTITMVVVQLAMGQFSPRIVQTFLRDRPSQLAIGLFVATFAHAMIAMRVVDPEADQVPGLAIVVAYVLVLTSIAMLVLYVDHIGRSLRVSALIELVGGDTRRLLDVTYPDAVGIEPSDPAVLVAPQSGVLIAVDREPLVALARQAGCVLHVVVKLGEFVPSGAPLVTIEGPTASVEREAVIGALHSGLERTLDQDVAYGFRMLVDMAERSLSESPFLDPTTAVQCIDRLHDGLRQLVGRVIPDGSVRDTDGVVRLTMPSIDWDAYVHLAFDEIRLAGANSPQVSRRMIAALHDLLSIAPPERRPALQEQLDLLRSHIVDSDRATVDKEFACASDAGGINGASQRGEPPTSSASGLDRRAATA